MRAATTDSGDGMSGQGRILVVDDIPQNVKLLADLLTVKGYEVVTASNGEEGLARIKSEKPDLVLLDVMMPGISGYDVCRRIREDPETTLLPVVLCTSLDPQQERINGMADGADDFLGKPINQPELFASSGCTTRRCGRPRSSPIGARRWNSASPSRSPRTSGSRGSSASSRPSSRK